MRTRNNSGHAVVEFALISPWIFTLFVGALNLGLLYHSITAAENAARSAAMYASSGPAAMANVQGACRAALRELRLLPNVRSEVTGCTAPPVQLSMSSPEGLAGGLSARASLAYTTVRLITMPPVPGQFVITREAEMRVKSE